MGKQGHCIQLEKEVRLLTSRYTRGHGYTQLNTEVGLADLCRSSIWRGTVFRLNIQGEKATEDLPVLHTVYICTQSQGRLSLCHSSEPHLGRLHRFFGAETLVLVMAKLMPAHTLRTSLAPHMAFFLVSLTAPECPGKYDRQSFHNSI